jgi:Protein of unknown function (DUF1579)
MPKELSQEHKAMETTNTQQEQTMKVEPQMEHEWLQQLVGKWNYETEVITASGPSPEKSTGTENVRSLGELWILAEGQGEMPGCGAATTLMTLGYDPHQQRYVGTWLGSMMTHLWVYDGELNPAKTRLTLNAEGPAMSGEGKMAKYRDVIEFKTNDYRVLSSHVLGDDGQWQQFMTAHYRRQ